MRKLFISILILCVFLSGCISTIRKSPNFDTKIDRVKTIAVMPADLEVYKLTAGGVRELIDEWTEQAESHVAKSLEKYLTERYGFKIKFVTEDWLKSTDEELWEDNKALYNAVASSALYHAYPGEDKFPTKSKVFDYTMGEEIQQLAELCEADALLFVYGYDHEATAGRAALWWWNLALGMYTGVMVLPTNPSALFLGLVDGQDGDVVWFKTTPAEGDYSFRNEKNMDYLIEWFTRDFLKKK